MVKVIRIFVYILCNKLLNLSIRPFIVYKSKKFYKFINKVLKGQIEDKNLLASSFFFDLRRKRLHGDGKYSRINMYKYTTKKTKSV